MKPIFILLLLVSRNCFAQSFTEDIENFRNNYVAEHLKDNHSPIKYQQVKDLDFYPPNENYKVEATVELIYEFEGFTMLTHTGKEKVYYRYAKCTFMLNNKKQILYLYQSKSLMQKQEYRDYLFMPFYDTTNYVSTFGGGRYLDFVLDDIKDNKIIIDFNKAYNPYCAYASGYNCPIPPNENKLHIAIEAGEKLYKGIVSEH